jgi:myo-inositol-1(or 4)-monophosphatase
MRMDLKPLLDTALAAARDAATIHRAQLGRVAIEDWGEKGVADFVTYVDREAERAIVDRIRHDWPDHRVLAEEAAHTDGADVPRDADALWVIDPLDGTTNYLHRYPQYAASVAFVHRGEPLVGVVLAGATGQTWTAVRAGGAFLDGARIHVSTIPETRSALIGTGFPFKLLDQLPKYQEQFARVVRRTAGVRRAGSAALDLCAVASGWFDGFWELYLAPWDVAAGALLVREAGGRITRLDGTGDVVGHGPIVAGNPYIHAHLLDLLGGDSAADGATDLSARGPADQD